MAAVAMIVGESDDLQLGFPSAYESQYAAHKVPLRAFPSEKEYVEPPMAGNDLQAQWHEQKRKDANYMSNAKVQSTINSIKRAYSAPHHEYNRPKYVLSQRKFANPSNEALIITSGRQNYDSAPFHYAESHQVVPNRIPLPSEMEGSGDNCETFRGGVLRSAAGQVHGHKMLKARVGQLNAIDSAKQQFDLAKQIMPGASIPAMAPFVDSFSQQSVDLAAPISTNLGLQRVTDLLMGADVLNSHDSANRSSDQIFSETRSVLGNILAMGAKASVSELSDTLGFVQNIEQLLKAALESDQDDPYMDEYANKTTQTTFITLQEIYKKLNTYLTRMVAGANLQPRERETLARSLVKSLSFAKSMNVAVGRSREALSLAERTGSVDTRAAAMDVASRGRLDHDADRREDTEHGSRSGGPGGGWGDENRTEFGWRSGESFPTNGRSVSWFGTDEGEVEYGEPPEDADTSGFNEEGSELPYRSRDIEVGSTSQGYSVESAIAPRGRRNPFYTTGPLRRLPQQPTDVPLRGFFDPDTQAFNVASSLQREAPPRASAGTVSSKASTAEAPVSYEAMARAREAMRKSEGMPRPDVAQLLKGNTGMSGPVSSAPPLAFPRASPSGRQRAPSGRRSAASTASEPGKPLVFPAFRSDAVNPVGSPRVRGQVPQSIDELPDDIEALSDIVIDLRARGYNASQVYGTLAAEGSPKFKAYIRNVKSNIMKAVNRFK